MVMLASLWTTFEQWILSLGMWGIVMIFILATLHPTLEGPAAILLLTMLTILIGSVWWASVWLLVAYLIGFSFFYFLVHYLHQKSQHWIERFEPTQQALKWVDQQPTWKHIVVIGLPLVYTYPLRIAFTITKKDYFTFAWQTFLQYLVLTLGNLLLYFGILQLLFFQLPIWLITIVLMVIAVGIYLIRTKVKII